MLDIRVIKQKWLHRWAFVICLSIAFSVWGLHTSKAHFLWVEASDVVQLGTEATIDIYFGEYHEALRERRGGRLDERLATNVRVITPSGESEAVKFEPKSNFFRARVNADIPGIYHLLASDLETPVKDLSKYGIGIVKPFYYARRSFLSFEQGRVSDRQVSVNSPQPLHTLDIIPISRHADVRKGSFGAAPNEEVVFQVFFNGKPLTERAKIAVYSPTGWLWDGKLDDRALGRFTPLWPGLYVVDVVYLNKTPGEYQGKPYEAERHRATLTVSVRAKAE